MRSTTTSNSSGRLAKAPSRAWVCGALCPTLRSGAAPSTGMPRVAAKASPPRCFIQMARSPKVPGFSWARRCSLAGMAQVVLGLSTHATSVGSRKSTLGSTPLCLGGGISPVGALTILQRHTHRGRARQRDSETEICPRSALTLLRPAAYPRIAGVRSRLVPNRAYYCASAPAGARKRSNVQVVQCALICDFEGEESY